MPTVLIPKERGTGETRVSGTPETVRKMVGLGLEVTVESGAGEAASMPDRLYEQAGGRIGTDLMEMLEGADVVLRVSGVDCHGERGRREIEALRPGTTLIGFLAPYRNLDTVRALADRGVSAFAMELIPRITSAQSMDALSSQASIGGYKAAILAADRLGRYFPLMMTAAGTIPPARVVVIGAGVAGLQALATAKRLGAVVEVSDIRPAVKEQVESLGGRFIDLPTKETGEGIGGYAREMDEDFLARQRQRLKEHIAAADVVITTAQVPGKAAPRLVTSDMVEAMKPGSVIVDVAAERGGNCEICRPGEDVLHAGVWILGPLNLPATMPRDSSTLYARNLLALLTHLLHDGEVAIDPEDAIVAGCLLSHDGRIVHSQTAERVKEAVA